MRYQVSKIEFNCFNTLSQNVILNNIFVECHTLLVGYDTVECHADNGRFTSIIAMVLWSFILYLSTSIPLPPIIQYDDDT